MISRFLSYPRSLVLGWLKQAGSLFWFCGACVTAMGFLVLMKSLGAPWRVDDYLRWLAFIFEFLGVLLVVLSINRLRKDFGRPGILGAAVDWLNGPRYPRLGTRDPLILDHLLPPRFQTEIAKPIARGDGVEDRLDWLKQAIDGLHQRVDTLTANLNEHVVEVSVEVQKEAIQREKHDRAVAEKLESTMIGDYSTELLGAGFLMLGLALSNLNQEFSDLSHWLWRLASFQ